MADTPRESKPLQRCRRFSPDSVAAASARRRQRAAAALDRQLVERIDIGTGAGDQRIGVRPGAARRAAIFRQHHRDFGLSIGARRHGMNLIQLQRRAVVRFQLADSVEQRINRAVTTHRRRMLHAIDVERQDRPLRAIGASINFDLDDLDTIMSAQHLVIDQRYDILVEHLLLGVCKVLEALEGITEFIV